MSTHRALTRWRRVEPVDLLRCVGAIALGAGARLLGNSSPESVEAELRMLDGFVDALKSSWTRPE